MHKTLGPTFFIGVIVSVVLMIQACSQNTMQAHSPTTVLQKSQNNMLDTLRVGMATNYPPIAFAVEGEPTGLEVSFAQQLADDLGKQLELKTYDWSELFAALDNGDVDILMSGISITPERKARFIFTDPYIVIGQMAIIRFSDAGHLSTRGALHSGRYKVGFVHGTTGDVFVNKTLTVPSQGYVTNEQGMEGLLNKEVDFFIHDAPTVWNLANNSVYAVPGNEKLLGLYRPFTQEPLAWVVSAKNKSLADQANHQLNIWRSNGRFAEIINQWIPVKIISNSN